MNKGTETRKKILTAVPVLLFMAVIFAFSAKNAAESTESSDAVVDKILELNQAGFEEKDEDSVYQMLAVIVRKGAHVSEYALLCILTAVHLTAWKLPYRKIALYSVLFSAFYAGTDEFHQLFVEGRSGQLTDVLIDSAGAVFGILIFTGIRCLTERRRRKKLIQNGSAFHHTDS